MKLAMPQEVQISWWNPPIFLILQLKSHCALSSPQPDSITSPYLHSHTISSSTDSAWNFFYTPSILSYSLLVFLGCYNKIPLTGWFTKQQEFISCKFLRLGGLRQRCQQIQCLVRACCMVHRWYLAPFLCVLAQRKRQRNSPRLPF